MALEVKLPAGSPGRCRRQLRRCFTDRNCRSEDKKKACGQIFRTSQKDSLNVGGYPHTKSTLMESSLPAGWRPNKISLNVGGLIKQVLGLHLAASCQPLRMSCYPSRQHRQHNFRSSSGAPSTMRRAAHAATITCQSYLEVHGYL